MDGVVHNKIDISQTPESSSNIGAKTDSIIDKKIWGWEYKNDPEKLFNAWTTHRGGML